MELISLKKALDLTPEEESLLGNYSDKMKDIAKFLSDAVEAMEGSAFLKAVEEVAPWVGEVANSSGLPFVKFATAVLGKLLKQKDPEVLGRLACTLAYQKATAQAIAEVGDPARDPGQSSVKHELRDFRPSPVVDFKIAFA